MKIFAGSDHAGFELRNTLVAHLRAQGHQVVDLGPTTNERSDYPDYAATVARAVRNSPGTWGLLVCASGIGVSIAANKVHGVRAANVWTVELARLARSHNDANVMCVGQKFVAAADATAMIDVFLNTPFEGGRHATRVDKIASIEAQEDAADAEETRS